MSDEDILEDIDVSQSGRSYRWQFSGHKIARRDIETQSANMHLVPATDDIESAMKAAREGEIVEIRGALIRVDADDGWRWVSSMTRNDTGARSCELVFVEAFRVLQNDT